MIGGMLLAGVLLVGMVGCAATGIGLPAVTDAPTGRHDTGRIIWHDLISNKPAESRRFYEQLFGWEFEPVGGLFNLGSDDTYSLIRHNGRLIGGMVNQASLKNGDKDISQWVVLMSVDDVDAAAARFEGEGGTILTPPTDVADRGRMAIAVDPQGALMALVETRDGDPPAAQPAYGDFLWNELWTSDVPASVDFYTNLVAFDQRTVEVSQDRSYQVMSRGSQPTVGIMAQPFPQERPVWVTYVRVEDPAAITARVEALGGKVYVPAQKRPLGGEVALIADPSGAGIALQTWPLDTAAD
jgi:hypothetical protein